MKYLTARERLLFSVCAFIIVIVSAVAISQHKALTFYKLHHYIAHNIGDSKSVLIDRQSSATAILIEPASIAEAVDTFYDNAYFLNETVSKNAVTKPYAVVAFLSEHGLPILEFEVFTVDVTDYDMQTATVTFEGGKIQIFENTQSIPYFKYGARSFFIKVADAKNIYITPRSAGAFFSMLENPPQS